jgi:Helix-turn-helix family
MDPAPTLARRFWEAIEPIHAIVYFEPAATAATTGLGLRGFWMGYFAGRVAPLGPLDAEPVTAMAFGFSPARVGRAIPDAWRFTTPERVVDARLETAARLLRGHLGDRTESQLRELADLLATAAGACRFDGRPLAAGWSAVGPPDDLTGRIWLATTVLREHRGDGHVLAAVSLGLRGIDAVLTHVAAGVVDRERMQQTRGWTDAEWAHAEHRIHARGLIDRDGRLTKRGGAMRRELESITDRLAADPVSRLGPAGIERAITLAVPISRHLFDTGVIPVPNPIGAPRP